LQSAGSEMALHAHRGIAEEILLLV
jgi:hypothetical protein